jgi:hypothetical protein
MELQQRRQSSSAPLLTVEEPSDPRFWASMPGDILRDFSLYNVQPLQSGSPWDAATNYQLNYRGRCSTQREAQKGGDQSKFIERPLNYSTFVAYLYALLLRLSQFTRFIS